MYEGNHVIDTPGNEWTPDAVERLFVFCQLDRVMSYKKVVKAYEFLESRGFSDFDDYRTVTLDDLHALLRVAGLRFPKETAHYLYYNVHHFDGALLHKMTREEIVEKCHGFGWKLASMFCNRCQGKQYAIIDVHIDRFLKINGCTAVNYKDKEKFFIELANKMGATPDELDWVVWDANRIGKKKEKKHVEV